MRLAAGFPAFAATVLALVISLAPPLARAQSGGPQWVPLDTQPPGTPASMQVDRGHSNGETTSLILVMHGFYREQKVAPDGAVYTKLTVPGLGSCGLVGGPDLPAVQLTLGVPQGMVGVRLAEATILASQSFPGTMVWPKAIPAKDDSLGEPEQYARNDSIYASRSPWPTSDADPFAPATPKSGAIMGAQLAIYPFRWTPATGQLVVASQMQVRFDNDGVAMVSSPITRRNARLASSMFPNWDPINTFYPPNLRHYDGQYLIVMPTGWQSSVQPLIYQKSARGFLVALRFVSTSGNTCDGIRDIIRAWYQSTPPEQDHYCLLVGEPSVIPLCSAPIAGSPPTDDLYASMVGDDLDPEVYVGRLSASVPAQVALEVQKIIDYMDHPPQSDGFKTAVLVAHEQEAPGKYVGAHESVFNASYADRPNFTRIYGNDVLARNSLVSWTINQGCGLVAYRGHGSSNSWAAWNGSESYSVADVAGLLNGAVTPVVWNIACSNHDLAFNESMGEWWLLRNGAGAVASYGATTVSLTNQNHELDRQLFKAVYDLGLTTHAQAIQYAEAQMASLAGSSNAWLYNLLGDPEMPIRRERPLPPWAVVKPDYISTVTGGSIPFTVFDTVGQPVPNLQLSLWKPPAPPAPQQAGTRGMPQMASGDEVFDNTYTDDRGDATLPVSPATPGWLYFTLQDDLGHSMLDSIPVISPTAVEPSRSGGLQFAAMPSLTRDGTRLGFGAPLVEPARIVLMDVAGRTVRRLEAKRGDTAVRWAGDDDAGRAVPPGLYLASLESGAARASTRVIVVR